MTYTSSGLEDVEAALSSERVVLTDAASPRVYYRWIVLAIAFSAFVVTFLDRLAWANASLLASKSLGVPLAALGVFVTAFYSGYVVTNALSGFATDRIGPRRMLVLALAPLGPSLWGSPMRTSTRSAFRR